MTQRGQLSIPTIEVSIGILLVFGVISLLTIGVSPPAQVDPQLEQYAEDTGTLLMSTGTDRAPPLPGVVQDKAAFTQYRSAIDQRTDRLLPDNLLYAIETPHGTIGEQPPAYVTTGRTIRTTPSGTVTITVYYA